MKTLIATVAAVCMATPLLATTLTDQYSSFYILGDSLSDTGKASRATDGLLWNEPIAAEFEAAGLDTQNFAYGSATAQDRPDSLVPDLEDQTHLLLGSVTDTWGDDPLVALFIGGNDVRAVIGAEDPAAAISASVAAFQSSVNDLIQAGVETIALFEVPDVGATPLANAFGISDIATALSIQFNQVLAELAKLPQVELVPLFALGQDVNENPADYGLVAAVPCVGPLAVTALTCEQTVYWDSFHPTSAVHALIEDQFRETLHPVPVPLSAALLLTGIGGLTLLRRRAA